MELVDSHCHLDLEEFDSDREAVLERAAQAGVGRILIPGISLTSSLAAVKLADNRRMLFAAVGVHPTEAAGVQPSTFDELKNIARHPKVKALGEIGLDYYWDSAPHDLQQGILRKQLALAAELSLPVVIHFREEGDANSESCASDLKMILEDWVAGLRNQGSPLISRTGVLHSFSGSLELARDAIQLGFYIGVSGPITYKNSQMRRELVAAMPLDRLLIETDAPFQTPDPHRGKRNEPAYVRLIADKIGLVHSATTGQVATATTANAHNLFAWE
jgi:TatD DNase family protein